MSKASSIARGTVRTAGSTFPEAPDYICHLGEYSRVEIGVTEPPVVWGLNIAGTFGVLEF